MPFASGQNAVSLLQYKPMEQQEATSAAQATVPFQYPLRRLIVRSGEVSKPPDLCLEWSNRTEIGQAPRQH